MEGAADEFLDEDLRKLRNNLWAKEDLVAKKAGELEQLIDISRKRYLYIQQVLSSIEDDRSIGEVRYYEWASVAGVERDRRMNEAMHIHDPREKRREEEEAQSEYDQGAAQEKEILKQVYEGLIGLADGIIAPS